VNPSEFPFFVVRVSARHAQPKFVSFFTATGFGHVIIHQKLNSGMIGEGRKMPTIQAQIWRGASLTIDRTESETDGTVFRFSGPFTAHGIYASLSPDALRNLFESPPRDGHPHIHIFDLTEVPYMDSLGLGMLASHYVRCQRDKIQLSITRVSPRVRESLRMTKMDTVLPIAAI